MERKDWTIPALLCEAVCGILEFVYILLQIYYGITYHVGIYKPVLNILASVLVYAALTLLAVYPERIHRIPPEACEGQVRKLSIRMVRMVKLIFVAGLMIPCVADVLGCGIQDAYSLIVMGLILVVAVYHEVRIIQVMREPKE